MLTDFFSSQILSVLDINKSDIKTVASFQIYISLLALPGYWFGIWLIEIPYFGRRNTQIFGLVAMGVIYVIMGISFNALSKIAPAFILVYGLTFFCSNAGPNTTTFVLPSEVFPTEIRATCHGISAAAGKVGAIIGAVGISYLLQTKSLSTNAIFYICGAISFIGAALTILCVPETLGIALEQLTIHQGEETLIVTED